ncbi:MAG: S41 family peptidase [Spirochaetaceae bacterium]|jgi:carboxyl-terminal processing protease|nr:S41 family peptidase [Spirochaetaceae bacterium]
MSFNFFAANKESHKEPDSSGPQLKPAGLKNRSPIVWAAVTIAFTFFVIGFTAPKAVAQSGGDQAAAAVRYTLMLQNVFDFIQKHYVEEIDPQKLYEGAMKGMFNALEDPYSAFLAEKEMQDLNQNVIKGTYGGVGLYISETKNPDGSQSFIEIASPMEGTPGWRAGLQPGDLIIKIGEDSTDSITMDEALNRLKGPAGEAVHLTIRRGVKLEFPVTLVRAVIEVPTVKHALIGDIGYLRLISFSNMTAERAKEALQGFKNQGYRGLVLDLRNNYGGLLQSAVSVSNLFLDGGLVVSVKSRIPGQNSVFNASKDPVVPENIPIVVLINKGSASASEIVAGALKDRGRAYLVGEKSFGKGSVQQVYPLDKSGFKITTARYFTPSNVNIDKIGIPPDKEVLFPQFSDEDAEQLNKLISGKKIPLFVENNPKAAPGNIDSFARQLTAEYKLDFSLVRRLIRDEQNRTQIAPVYDIEYDVQLQEAVRIIRDGNYRQLIGGTKNLRDLQEAAGKAETLVLTPDKR